MGFYRRFVKKFANLAAPLIALLAKNVEFTWGLEQQNSFEALKQALMTSAGLFLPSPDGKFRIYTDYSAEVISAILHQVQTVEGKEAEVPIAFSSRVCRGKEKTVGSAEGELLAAIFALTKYKQYVG